MNTFGSTLTPKPNMSREEAVRATEVTSEEFCQDRGAHALLILFNTDDAKEKQLLEAWIKSAKDRTLVEPLLSGLCVLRFLPGGARKLPR